MTTLYNADPGIPLYLNSKGSALDGLIYFGVPNLNPVTNPATVYWDAAGTQPAAQPIAVSAGRTVRTDGTPARVWISGDYSKLVLDTKGGQVDFQANQQTPSVPVTVTVDKFSGTGAPATYTLSVTPQSINDTSVFVGGVYQQKSSYTLVGNQLTITAASGVSNVEVNTAQNLDWTSIASTLTTSAATAQTNATTATAEAVIATTQATNAAASAAAAGSFVSPVSVADYTGLRAYAGTSVTLNVTGYLGTSAPSGTAGTFTRDDIDTTSADNGGTIIVASNGKRWKRVFSGPAQVDWFGAAGDGATLDTSAIQAALGCGAKRVEATPWKTYLVGHTATFVANGTNQRYCLIVPTGVVFDLKGATVKAAAASNSSPIAMNGVTDSGVVNAVIDCNKANQTTPATGEIGAIYAYNCTRPTIESILAKNCRMYAGRFLANTGGRYVNLWSTDSDADGWSFGIDGGGTSMHVVEAFIDNIYAENCTQVYGGGYQGNPAIFTTKRCNVGKVTGKNCSGAIKIQDSSADTEFASLLFIGPTNGGVNSGIKVQGNGAGLQPQRIQIGNAKTINAYGNGLYVIDSLSVEIGRYQGLSNGTGASATGSDQYDVNLDAPSGGRYIIESIDVQTPGTRCGRALGAGIVKVGTLYGKTPVGVGFSYNGTGEFYCNDMRIDDGGTAMTRAFQATNGKGRIGRFSTNVAHDTANPRVNIQTALYDWTIDSIRVGSTDVYEGVVQLTNTATATPVTCGHIWREYVGGASDYFQPIFSFEPLRSSTRALNSMYAVVTDGSTGTGFSLKHAAAGASDFVFWKVVGWKVGSTQAT